MVYDQDDKTARLALAYGEHNVDPRNGKLIRHKTSVSGSDLQTKAQFALGLGPWHAAGLQTYDGAEIASSNYIFHPGTTGETAADAYFPTDVDHPGAAFINFDFPLGMANDNDPDKWVGRFQTREVADYNSSGVQTSVGYSTNFARCTLDGIKVIRPRLLNYIEYASFIAWRDWCDQLISVTKDGVTVSIKRFECHLFFIPPFTLAQFLDRMCQLSCTDWQWRGGKIRFIPPTAASSVFTYNLGEVSDGFKFTSLTGKNRPNGVRVIWRDFDDPYLSPADPIEIKRTALIDADDGIENFLEINAGVCNKSQAERLANYWAKRRCDLTDFVSDLGSFKSYPVLPGDVALVTNDIPDWTDKRVRLLKKEEDEDAGVGYPFYAQIEPTDPYSDTDHTPIETRAPGARPNRYGAPPAITSMSLTEIVTKLEDGTIDSAAVGLVTFGAFGFKQRGKLYWKAPGGSYEEVRDLTPNASNQAQFRKGDLKASATAHKFKVIVLSEAGVQQTAAVVEYDLVIDGKDDAPNPPSSFTLTYDGLQYRLKFTKSPDPDVRGYNVYDNSDVFLYFKDSTEFAHDSSEASLTLKIKAVDTSGNESTAVSATGGVPAPVIAQYGPSSLDLIQITVSGFKGNLRYRKIQQASNSGFTSIISTVTKDYGANPPLTASMENLERTFSPTPETRYVRVAHGFTSSSFGPWSNTLTITFQNDNDSGVPEIDGAGELDLLGSNWTFKFPRPYKNGNVARTSLELMLIDDTNFTVMDGAHSASATTITTQSAFRDLTAADGFPASGKASLYRSSDGVRETVSYTSRDANHLYGVTRGIDGTTALAYADGDGVWYVGFQEDLGNTVFFTYPQLAHSYYAFFRWRNEWGYSVSIFMGRVTGTLESPTPSTIPTPPPPAPPSPPAGYENPFDPDLCFVRIHPHYVWMADGSSKLLSEVKAGDSVKTELDGRIVTRKVVNKFENRAALIQTIEFGDDLLKATQNHPFKSWETEGYTKAKDLIAGSEVTGFAQEFIKEIVQGNKKQLCELVVDNIEVEDTHRYFVRHSLEAKWKLVGNMKERQLRIEY